VQRPQRKYGKDDAWLKVQRYCAYQERSHYEVREKLYSWGLYRNEVDAIMADLITEGFLNEERFARAYVSGKFRMKQWGRIKIKLKLKEKRVTDYCIRKGMEEIDEDEYLETLRALIDKKNAALNEPNEYIRYNKSSKFVIGKGYESQLVWEVIKELKSSSK
jgi:regulatory protein